MRNLTELIKQARRHVEDGRKIILRQRERIADGTAVPGRLELLQSFEQSQAMFEKDLARLLRERGASA